MKKKWLFIVSFLLLQVVAISQKMITLNEFITFSEYKNNLDFISFIKKYNYKLNESNLAKEYIYDDVGFVKETKLKKFNKLKNGDSLLFIRSFRINRSEKKIKAKYNRLSFFKKRDTLLIDFSTTSEVADYDYFNQLYQESQNQGFKTISTDTLYNESGMNINYECRKGDYYLKCNSISKTNDSQNRLRPRFKEKDFQINFIRIKAK